jgi:hypothetical protein
MHGALTSTGGGDNVVLDASSLWRMLSAQGLTSVCVADRPAVCACTHNLLTAWLSDGCACIAGRCSCAQPILQTSCCSAALGLCLLPAPVVYL